MAGTQDIDSWSTTLSQYYTALVTKTAALMAIIIQHSAE